MATTALSTVSNRIEWSEGAAWGKIDRRVNGSTEVYPGYALTGDGNTPPDVSKLDAAGESFFAVAGLLGDHPIDDVYDDNEVIPVYLPGSGWGIWCYRKKAQGGHFEGEIMVADTEDTGHFEPLSNAIAGLGTLASLATILLKLRAYAGRAGDTQASNAAVLPFKLRLAI